ncbi:transposase domain-containing protein [Streptomyces sp. 6-11-2]|uniref:transposase domain-containing protein n=1 Tax=Streptomyces sp. 6-11-2 TaxID=2585753 RepID=UPI0035A66D98
MRGCKWWLIWKDAGREKRSPRRTGWSAKTSRSQRPEAPLSGQSVITREVAVAEGVFAPGHLGEMTQTVPFEMVDEVLAECRAVQQRLRKLPARGGVVYLLLAATLFEECGYPAAWRKLTGTLDALPLPRVTATALWHARTRLGVRPLQALCVAGVSLHDPREARPGRPPRTARLPRRPAAEVRSGRLQRAPCSGVRHQPPQATSRGRNEIRETRRPL